MSMDTGPNAGAGPGGPAPDPDDDDDDDVIPTGMGSPPPGGHSTQELDAGRGREGLGPDDQPGAAEED